MAEDTEVLTTEEAAELLRVSTKTILSLARHGELPGEKVGRLAFCPCRPDRLRPWARSGPDWRFGLMSPSVTTNTPPESIAAPGQIQPLRFRPRLSFGYYHDLVALIRDLSGRSFDEQVGLVRASIDTIEARRVQLGDLGVGEDDLQPTVFYAATLRLLRDLLLQGWTSGSDDDGLFILPPSLTAGGVDPSEAKSLVRESFRFALADQLLTPSVTSFITRG